MPEVASWAASVPAEPILDPGSLPVSILVVDDDEHVRELLVESLSDTGYRVSFAATAEDALAQLRARPYDLVLSDVQLPGMDGIELSRALAETDPGLPVVLITGHGQPSLARSAMQHGASDFVTKPIQLDTLAIIIERNLERQRIVKERAAGQDHQLMIKSIRLLAAAIDAKQSYTARHSRRVAALASVIGSRYGLSGEDSRILEFAAQVHDVGKIGVPDEVLNKAGALSDEEWEAIRTHPEKGAEIVGRVEELSYVADVVLYHHEQYNGSGYPCGLRGNGIPLLSRIIAVADAYECMTSDRAYRSKLSSDEAIRRLKDGAGSQFDSVLVESFCELHHEGLVW